MADARPRRLLDLRARLVEQHLDAILVSSLPNVRYLTGFAGLNALLLVTARESWLLSDFRYEAQIGEEVGDSAQVRIEKASLWSGLWELLQQLSGVSVIGFESPHLSHRVRSHFRLSSASCHLVTQSPPRHVAPAPQHPCTGAPLRLFASAVLRLPLSPPPRSPDLPLSQSRLARSALATPVKVVAKRTSLGIYSTK